MLSTRLLQNRSLRICAMLVALIALLAVSAAAESPAHFHLKQPPSGCDLCFAAHLASSGAQDTQPWQAPDVEARNTIVSAFFGYERISRNRSLSRGPPSLSL